jgi:ferredoxin
MGEILEAMFAPDAVGATMPPPEVHHVGPYVAKLQAVKQAVDVPVIAKFSALFHADVVTWATAVEDAGADAIACADAFGPVIGIDIETGEPLLGGPRGAGGLTGPALKPIALRMILEMAQNVSIPLIGVGGIRRAEDAIEYFMAGASFVGVVTAGHLEGAETFGQVVRGIDDWVGEHGYDDVADFIGLSLRRIEERRKRNLIAITTPQPPIVDPDLCTGCGECEVSCVYEAIEVGSDGVAEADVELCYGCGLCRDVCRFGAIRFAYYQ